MRLVLAALAVLLLITGSASAHVGGMDAVADPNAVAGQAAPPAIPNPGPCTAAAAEGMPEGEGHDHQDIEQHRNLSCGIEQVAFLSLVDELKDRPDVVLGEMDVKADIAAVSVIYPEGGVLFFDVSDPSKPEFLSWYRDADCESVAVANNCGAFVDLSADAKTAIIGVQNLTLLPFPDPNLGGAPVAQPGVQIVDLSDPRNPERGVNYSVVSQGGVHTARTFPVADGPAKGEYVYAIANGIGVDISKFSETPAGARVLTKVADIPAPAIHDTFTQVDPIDGKTYLYIADGFGSGFQVYDVTDPSSPEKVAEWDLTPECTQDWYAHTIDVTHRGDKRYVTLPAELFGDESTPQNAANQGRGCGKIRGNGDKAGPLWIVDASDFSALGRPGDSDADVKAKSESALVTTWTNPAGRAAGNLTFSPHNQQIVGDKIYLSDYHGGVFVLDAAAAFAGRSERPRELAYTVPAGDASNEAARPIFAPPPGGPMPRMRGRTNIWDMVFYKGHVLAADQVGGFYSLQYEGDVPAVPGSPAAPGAAPKLATAEPGPTGGQPLKPGCDDRLAPRSRFPRRGGLKITRRGLDLQGTARDRGCSGRVARVLVAVARQQGAKRCRFVTARGRLGKARPCSRPTYVPARGTARWTLRLRAKLPAGRYRAQPRGIDAAGNVETRSVRFKRVR